MAPAAAMPMWMSEKDLTTAQALHQALGSPPSKYHKPELARVEEDVVAHFFKPWFYYCNNVLAYDHTANEPFYDWDDQVYFDLMGNIARGAGFKEHFRKIGPYMCDANVLFRDLEVTAVSEDFVHTTQMQNFKGKTRDGHAFEYSYRLTQLIRKTGAGWKIVHEHLSFPCDMKTGTANFSGSDWNIESAYDLGK